MLFENELFNLTRIHNVVHYAPHGHKEYTYPSKLPTYELMYYEKGDTTVRFNGQTFHMTAGSLLYLPKGLENNRYTVSVEQDFSLYNIYFDTDSPLPANAVQIISDNGEFKAQYEKIYRLWVGKQSGYYYKTMQQAYHIMDVLRRVQQRYSPDNKLRYLSSCDQYLAEHYCDKDFDYQQLIKRSGLSYSYFKKLFIDKYGCPPVKYVMRLKINRACELLQTKQFRVSEVANLCGFDNVYYFSTVFKKQMGVSPKHYGAVHQ